LRGGGQQHGGAAAQQGVETEVRSGGDQFFHRGKVLAAKIKDTPLSEGNFLSSIFFKENFP
jgi:hypothetical protein